MKRLSAMLLGIIMLIMVIPGSAFAAGGRIEIETEAAIGSTEYDSLEEAIAQCGESDVIVLLKDIGEYTPCVTPESPKCFTISKGGYAFEFVPPEGELFISTENDNGSITYHECSVNYLWSAGYASCTAEAVCRKYESHVVLTETATATVETIPASCIEDGATTYTAVFEALGTAEKKLYSEAAGHSFVNHKCSECGTMEEGYSAGGSCGADTFWALDDDGMLTITGTGAADGEGFAEYSSAVTGVVIDNGITVIEDNAFSNFTVMREVTLPSTLERIGTGAFDGCGSLEVIHCDITDEGWKKIEIECTLPESAHMDLNSKLSIVISTGSNILKIGDEPATVTVKDAGGNLYDEIELVSGSEKTVSVSGNEITGLAAGQATVTATLRNDRYGRSVSTVISVVGSKPEEKGFYILPYQPDAGELEGPSTEFNCDAAEAAESSLTFIIGTKLEDGIIAPDGLTYASTDSKVAKLSKVTKGDYKNCYMMTVPKSTSGSCTITASYTDKKNPSANYTISMSVNVKDYAPKTETAKLTLNPNLSGGVSVQLVSSYGNVITGVKSIEEGTKSGKTYQYKESDRLTAEYSDGILTIKRKNPEETLKDQTMYIRVNLTGELCDSDLCLTVSVKNSMPKVTVKQTSKLNTFCKPGAAKAEFVFTVKDAVITDVKYYDECSYKGSYSNGVFTVTDNGFREKGKPINGSVEIALEGYSKTVIQKLSVATASTAPALKLSSSSCSLYIADGVKKTATVEIINSDGSDADIENVEILSGNAEIVEQSGNILTLELKKDVKKNAYVKTNVVLKVENDALWTKPVQLKYTINITSAPSLKLSKSSMTINAKYPAFGDYTDAVLLQSNVAVKSYRISEVVAKGKSVNEALNLYYEAGQIRVEVKDESLLCKGKYTYQFDAALENGQQIKPVKFTVSVTDAKATATLKASGKMDLCSRGSSEIIYTVTLKNVSTELTGVRLLDAKTKEETDVFDVKVLDGKRIRLAFGDTDYSATSYKFIPAISVSTGDGNEEEILCSAQTVKLSQSALKVNAPAVQTVYQSNSGRVLTYRLSLSSPAGATIDSVRIGKPDALFTKSLAEAAGNISFSMSNDRTAVTVKVTLSDTSKLVSGKTYTLPIIITPCGALNSKSDASVKLTLKVLK